MSKTRLRTVPEILEHINLLISETERSYQNHTGYDTGARLYNELTLLRDLRAMIVN
jgi:hypothetical protein